MSNQFENRWTEVENTVIREHWHSGAPVESWAHLLPGRTIIAIEKHGQYMKLGKRARATDWTEEEDANIRRLWPTGERFKAHMDLFGGRSYFAIMNRAYELGLGKRPNCPRGQSAIAWTLIEREMAKGPSDRRFIAAALTLHPSTVYTQINIAHKARLIHIVKWNRRSSGGKPTPIYVLGPGEDAPMPDPLTNTEACRIYRTRKQSARNPFAVAAGQVQAPVGSVGRRFVQDMEGGRIEREAA
ncbi:hypothetical protein WCQ02_31175 [Paraburkholderia tropica]|uniref:hypothetical protein n=1 Tax=Paraburkholderia tropica TaxID=92647 RepID=UPI00301892E4